MQINKLHQLLLIGMMLLVSNAFAATKTAISSGNWSSSSNWSPSGAPGSSDDVIIGSGISITVNNNYTVRRVTVQSGALLDFPNSPSRTLTISTTNGLINNGTVDMNRGNISFSSNNTQFRLGPNSLFIWNPGNNASSGATVWTRGIENFDSTSTLVISRWYSYSTPLGSVVTGDFGNLTFNNGNASEWDQNNYFETNLVKGTLTIDDAWITFCKSNSISNTTIGNIVLLNSSSYLDVRSGSTLNSNYSLNTNSISIGTGAQMVGNYMGRGDFTLNVTENFSNSGDYYGAYATGFTNTTGNHTISIGGSLDMSDGYFLGVYSTSPFSSGLGSLVVGGDLNFTGGVFLLSHTIDWFSNTVTVNIGGDASINFDRTAVSTFRFIGRSSNIISNTSLLDLDIAGNLTFNGLYNDEFTSSASRGNEDVNIGGSLTVNAADCRFNGGAGSFYSHDVDMLVGGNLSVGGGYFYPSYWEEDLHLDVIGNYVTSGGSTILKYDFGNFVMNISGNYTQTGGSIIAHAYNPTTDTIQMNLYGDFYQDGGTYSFCTHSSCASSHDFNMYGANYTLTSVGTITRINPGTSTAFGFINFRSGGTINFDRSFASNTFEQTKYTVLSGTTLNLIGGDLQLASHNTAGHRMMEIFSSGRLDLNSNQTISNGSYTYSLLHARNGATIYTSRTEGLYDGTANAAISSANNLDYYLGNNSYVVYDGTTQTVTGTGVGLATSNNHKYGNLTINSSGIADVDRMLLANNNVAVRNQLNLINGELGLNDYTLTIENGASNAIIRTSGYIKGETTSGTNSNIILWQSMSSGSHVFPFGYSSTEYIPIDFNLSVGAGSDVSASTRATATTDNLPWTGPSSVAAVSHMNDTSNTDRSVEAVIDRWWNFTASGVTADVTLSYRGVENTLSPVLQTGNLARQYWDGSDWSPMAGTGIGVTSGIGTVAVSAAGFFSPWIIVSTARPLPVEMLSFDAIAHKSDVELIWRTASEQNNDYFTVEKSTDGVTFHALGIVNGNGTTSTVHQYRFMDYQPLNGVSYYRIKQTDFNGSFDYSAVKSVVYGQTSGGFNVSTYINPQNENLQVNIESNEQERFQVSLYSVLGQQILSESVFVADKNYNLTIDTFNQLRSGIYFLEVISTGQSKRSIKIVRP